MKKFPPIPASWVRAAAAITVVLGSGMAEARPSILEHAVLTYQYKDCGDPPSVFEFPFFRHDAGGAGARINSYLHTRLLETDPPAAYRATPLQLPSGHWMNGRVTDVETEVAWINDNRVVTVTAVFSRCFSSAPPESMSYAFDPRDGRPLLEDELFTKDGRRKLKAHLLELRRRAIAQQITRLQKRRAKTRDSAESEQIESFIGIYQACLRDRYSIQARLDDDSLLITRIGQGYVEFGKGRCFPNTLVTEDELGDFYNKLGRAQLAPYLTSYGRSILFG